MNLNFIALDFETARENRDSICSIGYCVVQNSEIIESENILIKPPNNEYSSKNISIHNIQPEKTINKPEFPIVWDRIKSKFLDVPIYAHNALNFEKISLFKTFEYYNINYKESDFKFCCSYELAKSLFKELKEYNLSNLCKLMGISFNDEKYHNSEYDAIKVAEFVLRIKPFFNFDDFLKVSIENNTKKRDYTRFLDKKIPKEYLGENIDIEDKSHLFYNKRVVITGEFINISNRSTMAKLIKEVGGINQSSISGKTDFVIVGQNAGPRKLEQINQYGITVFDEQGFISLFKNKISG